MSWKHRNDIPISHDEFEREKKEKEKVKENLKERRQRHDSYLDASDIDRRGLRNHLHRPGIDKE